MGRAPPASPTLGTEGGDILKGERRTGNPRYFSTVLSVPLSAAEGNHFPGFSWGWAGMSWDFSSGIFHFFYLTSHIPGSVPPLILLLYDLQQPQALAAGKRPRTPEDPTIFVFPKCSLFSHSNP